YDLKRELTYMQVNVAPMQDVLSQLVRSANPLLPEEVRVYLRDVLDHSLRINQTIDVLRDMLGTALTVNQALVTQAQGEVVKRLGAWAALLAVPTLVTSWYGMNFRAMPELDGRYAYPALLVGVAAVCVGLYRRFRRIGWLYPRPPQDGRAAKGLLPEPHGPAAHRDGLPAPTGAPGMPRQAKGPRVGRRPPTPRHRSRNTEPVMDG